MQQTGYCPRGPFCAFAHVDRKCLFKVFTVKSQAVVTVNDKLLNKLRGCLHDTGATFAPERVHSGSLSWLYISLHDTTTKFHAVASHPGMSSPKFLYRGENFTPV